MVVTSSLTPVEVEEDDDKGDVVERSILRLQGSEGEVKDDEEEEYALLLLGQR